MEKQGQNFGHRQSVLTIAKETQNMLWQTRNNKKISKAKELQVHTCAIQTSWS